MLLFARVIILAVLGRLAMFLLRKQRLLQVGLFGGFRRQLLLLLVVGRGSHEIDPVVYRFRIGGCLWLG